MRADIRKAIEGFFPGKFYENPLSKRACFSPEHRKLIYEMIGEIKHRVGRELTHATDGQYDLSERIVIKNHFILRLSFLGPFAHLNLNTARRHLKELEMDLITKEIKEVLNRCEFLLLNEGDVLEAVSWLERGDSLVVEKVRVWNCLFCEY